MKKNIITFFLLLSVIFSGYSQVLIGNGTNTSQFAPFNPYWNYTYTQSIYLNSEINASGLITSIRWYFKGNGVTPKNDNIVIYMGSTTKTSFTSTSDWVPEASMTKVFEGKIMLTSPSGDGWKTITLTTPFWYTAGNLVIATNEIDPFTDKTKDYLEQKFYNFPVSENRTIYLRSDATAINAASPPDANNVRAFVPNIVIGGITQSCETPHNLTTSNIAQTTATVSWENLGHTVPANGSEYYVSTSSVAPDENTTPTGTVSSGFTANLSLLQPGTTYLVYVRNNCGGGEFSNWSYSSLFTTLCPDAVSTFYENFDNLNTITPNLPNCWSKILRANTGTLCPNAIVESVAYNAAVSEPNVVSLRNCNSTDDYDIMLVTPKLANLKNSPNRLTFYSRGGIIEVGTLNNNTDTGVFTVYKTYNTYSSDSFTKYEIPFKDYIGDDTYIGIRMKTNNDQQTSVYVDNVSWSFDPQCPDVTQVNVPDVTATTASIGWSEGGQASSWDITVGPPSTTDPNTLPYFSTQDSGLYVLENLNPATNYKAWVRSVCDAPDGNGAWIGPVTFKTGCDIVEEFSETFNSTPIPTLPGCWSKILRANNGVLKPNANVVTADYNVYNNTRSVTLKSDNSSGNYDVILVSPRVSTLSSVDNPVKKYRLRFTSRFSNKRIEIGTLSSSTNTAVWTLFKTVYFNQTGKQEEYFVDFTDYSGEDQFIGIRLPNDDSAGFVGESLDNIIWQPIPSCPEVSNVAVTYTTENTATVNWTSTPAESSWDVSYGSVSATNPDIDNLPIESATYPSPPFDLIGLNAGTTYKVWVRANCEGEGKGTGEWVGPTIFTTECPAIGPFYENFDAVGVPNLPQCWSKILRGPKLSQYASIGTIAPTTLGDFSSPVLSSPNVVQMSAAGSATDDTDIILVSPKLNNLQGKNRLKFDTQYPGRIEVGTLNGNTPNAVFTPLLPSFLLKVNFTNNTLTGDSPVIEVTDYRGPDTYIGIRLIANPSLEFDPPTPEELPTYIPGFPSIYVDNIRWEPIPGCKEVTDLNVPTLTTTTATIAWTKGQDETSWELVYGTPTDTNPDALTPIISADTNPFVLNELSVGTSYKVWVRAVCGGELGVSPWSDPVTFTTKCTSTNVPYLQDFNTAIVPSLPNCTTETKIGFAGNWSTTNANNQGYDSQLLRYVGDFSAEANAWFFTQGINLEAGKSYTISYKYGSNSNGPFYLNDLKVMYGITDTPSGMTLPTIADYQSFYGFVNNASIDFTAPNTDVYYFGFNAYSLPGQGFIFLDNIAIDEKKLSNNEFDLSKFSYYPNPVKDILNISYIKEISKITVYNILGQEVRTKSVKGTTNQVDMSGLSNGTYMVKVISENQTQTIKIIKQ